MKYLVLFALIIASPANASVITVPTAAGMITVASHLASRFQALIRDFVSAGYRPRHVGCYASGGHVRNSRHYAGAACDFDQRGWGKTVGFMYRAHAIIARHGFRDGCSFRDCGHVDDGVALASRRLHRVNHAYAYVRSHHHHRRHYRLRHYRHSSYLYKGSWGL